MAITLIRDNRSTRTNVVLAEFIDGKRKTKQIGTICSQDRALYSRRQAPLIYSGETSNPQEQIAINELLRFHDAVLNRTYKYWSKSAEFAYSNLSKEDRAKIDNEIKQLTLEWNNALIKAFSVNVRSAALDESIKPEKILNDLKKLLGRR